MGIFDVLVAIILGIVEGITEWLPISSTGHMILVNQFLTFSNDDFTQMFLVVVQLGAIMAVVLLFWKKIFPFNFQYKQNNKPFVKMDIMTLWFKILVATIPAAIVGVLFDDVIDEMFYNQIVVAGALIIYGILFIVVERWNKFYLAIPVMFGASLLKIIKSAIHGLHYGPMEVITLLVGMIVAFIISLFVIRFLMDYIRKHDFTGFGWYRIILGIVVIAYFAISGAAVL